MLATMLAGSYALHQANRSWMVKFDPSFGVFNNKSSQKWFSSSSNCLDKFYIRYVAFVRCLPGAGLRKLLHPIMPLYYRHL